MRRGGRQPQVPGAEVPENRRDQQRKHHGEARTAADLQYQLDGQQGDDAERHRTAREQHAEEIEHPRIDHRHGRGERMGVNHGCDRIGGVVEAIDELEAERDEERDAEQEEREQREPVRHRPVDIGHQAVARIPHADQQQGEEQQDRRAARRAIERRSFGGNGWGGNAAHGAYSWLAGETKKRMTEIFRIYDGEQSASLRMAFVLFFKAFPRTEAIEK